MSETKTSVDGRAAEQSPGERLADDMADVVRDEVRTFRADLADAARPASSGLLLVGAAAGVAVLAGSTASVTLLRVLEMFLPKTLAAAALTAGYLAGAASLGTAGLARLDAAGGSSKRLADRLRQAMRTTARPAGRAAASAAREAATA